MFKDFTHKSYLDLLKSLQKQTFSFLPFNDFINSGKKRIISLRHDVDLLPYNSLEFARIQHAMKIRGSYYFRAVPESWNEKVIKEIHELGHEVGYHYECLTTTRGDIKLAIEDFKRNLEKLRNLVPVSTICMHGSPRSKWDSRELWNHYDYREYGINGEPYFDIDFSKTAYYTDTGRMWDGEKYSVRDKVAALPADNFSEKSNTPDSNRFPMFHSTQQMISSIQSGTFPERAMLTFHPQRWTDRPLPWLKELLWQKTKNRVKYYLIQKSARGL